MEVQEWIKELEVHCARGQQLRGLGSDIWTRDLLAEESEILMAIADSGAISLDLPAGSDLPILLVLDQPVFPGADPFKLLECWNALLSLARRGVLSFHEERTFTFDEPARLKGARLKSLRLLRDDFDKR